MYIEVNHSYFKNAIREINDYVNSINTYMKLSSDKIYTLTKTSWKSTDGKRFYTKWLEQTEKTSVTEHLKAALREYANSLKYAEEQYKDAQSKAITNASMSRLGL